MNAELKTKWIAALRSGQYQQGKTRLRANERFCCLGVLCDIVDPSKWQLPLHSRLSVYYYDRQVSYLPFDLINKAQLPAGMDYQLASVNDNSDSFAPAIEWIEDNL